MKISTLGYSIRQGFKNIRRNLLFSLASIGTIIACVFLFGVFYSVVENMQQIVRSVEDSLTISVFFDENTDEERIKQIGEELQGLDNVASVNYITADKAWESYINDVYQGDTEYVHSVFGEDNPLQNSASYEITLKNIKEQKTTVERIQSIAGVRKVNSSDSTANNLNSLQTLVTYSSISVIVILLFVSLFLISNTITIGISVRKEEIAIMKLIGAKDFFVRAPYLVEGIIIGLIGSVIPQCIVYFLYKAVTQYLKGHFSIVESMVSFVPVGDIFKGLTPIAILFGVGVGFFGSLVTTHRHLKV